MQRITTLLQKINDLASKDKDAGLIDIDLMMDYTRVLYADLLEWRGRVSFNNSLSDAAPVTQPAPPPAPAMQVQQSQDVVATASQPVNVVEKTEEPREQTAHTATPAADIRKLIGINDKYQFISEMFGNDKDAYETILNQVNESSDYNTAIEMLDDVHAERGWQDEDITIQSFYGILSKFFSDR